MAMEIEHFHFEPPVTHDQALELMRDTSIARTEFGEAVFLEPGTAQPLRRVTYQRYTQLDSPVVMERNDTRYALFIHSTEASLYEASTQGDERYEEQKEASGIVFANEDPAQRAVRMLHRQVISVERPWARIFFDGTPYGIDDVVVSDWFLAHFPQNGEEELERSPIPDDSALVR